MNTPSHRINHPIKRLFFLCAGLIIMAFGVAFSIKAALGTSPISSVPYVTSAISGLSVGTTTIIMNFLFVLIQIAILRKQYDWFQLLQLPAAILFGTMIDVARVILQPINVSGYLSQWILCAIGIFLVAVRCQRRGHGKPGHHRRRRHRACHLQGGAHPFWQHEDVVRRHTGLFVHPSLLFLFRPSGRCTGRNHRRCCSGRTDHKTNQPLDEKGGAAYSLLNIQKRKATEISVALLFLRKKDIFNTDCSILVRDEVLSVKGGYIIAYE